MGDLNKGGLDPVGLLLCAHAHPSQSLNGFIKDSSKDLCAGFRIQVAILLGYSFQRGEGMTDHIHNDNKVEVLQSCWATTRNVRAPFVIIHRLGASARARGPSIIRRP